MNTLNRNARLAGILYLIITVLAPFSMMYLPSTLVVAGDAAATTQNLLAAQGIFRVGMANDVVVFLIEVVLTVVLYDLFKPVNPSWAQIATFARLGMTIIQGINLLNHFMVLLLISGASYLSVFTLSQLQALTLLFLNLHSDVVLLWGLFFGFHLVVLGILAYQSRYLPKLLGLLLEVVALCYFVQSFGTLLLPQYKATFTSIGLLAMLELAFPLWLLFKGVPAQPATVAAQSPA